MSRKPLLKECPECAKKLGRSGRGTPTMGKQAIALFGVAAIATALWIAIVILWSPAFLVPKGVGGIVLCGLFYLWPGLALGVYASSLPKVRRFRCISCGWSDNQTMGS